MTPLIFSIVLFLCVGSLVRQPIIILYGIVVIPFGWIMEQQHHSDVLPIVSFLLVHLISLNIVSFIAYGWDKRMAQRGGWRISERSLHIMMFLGGTLGAFSGSKYFRHKTKKRTFKAEFWVLALLQVLLTAWAILLL